MSNSRSSHPRFAAGDSVEESTADAAVSANHARDRDIGVLRGDPAKTLRQLLRDWVRDDVVAVVRAATTASIAETGRGLDCTGADLGGLDLRGLYLRRVTLTRARLDSTLLVGSDLGEAVMVCPLMERTTMRGAVLTGLYSHALSVVSSDWSGVRMPGAIDSTGALFHGVALTDANLSGGNYAGTTFYQCDLTNADLRGCEFLGATFNECVMRGTRMDAANVSHVTITRSNADGMVLSHAIGAGLVMQAMTGLSGLNMRGARLSDLRIRAAAIDRGTAAGASLPGLQLTDVTLAGCDFSGADLTETTWRGVTGQDNSLVRVQMAGGTWTRCRLPCTDLRGASMENARLLECVMPSSRFTTVDDGNGQASFSGRALIARDCDLSDADFTDAYLYRACFTGDPVTGMRLDRCTFAGANLIQAYVAAALPHADLTRLLGAYSRFNQSDLTGANLTAAGLYQASFVKAVLTDANLAGVQAPVFFDRCRGMEQAILGDDLSAWTADLAAALARRRIGST